MFEWPAEWFDEIDSTNEEARRRVAAGNFSSCWIVARQQSAGRGRLGRSWKSPSGNLFATAYFQYQGSLQDASKIPFVSALAVSDVFYTFAPEKKVKLKWPNDVRFQGAKLCGILVEAGLNNNHCWIAAGMGLNIAQAPENTGQPVACLSGLRGDGAVTADMAFQALRSAFADRMHQFQQGFQSVREDWLKRAEGLGETASIKRGNETLIGVFDGLGPDGEFMLRLPDGALQPITAGEVELVRKE